MILFSSPDKPLPRAGKGTVMRKAALELYASDIASMYVAESASRPYTNTRHSYNTVEEEISAIDFVEPPAVWKAPAIQIWLLKLASNICNSGQFSPTVDLRLQGFDRSGFPISDRSMYSNL